MNSSRVPSVLPSFLSPQTPHNRMDEKIRRTDDVSEASSFLRGQHTGSKSPGQNANEAQKKLLFIKQLARARRVPVLFVPVSGAGYFIQN